MDSLPKDMIAHILSRLIVKHVLQCKSVSHDWYDLITHPCFAKLHRLHHHHHHHASNLRAVYSRYPNSPHTSLFDSFDDETPLGHPPHYPRNNNSVVVGSCHGLLCLSDSGMCFTRFVLFNPSTRLYNLLPWTPFQGNNHISQYMLYYGFGYDATTDDYKVLRIAQTSEDPNNYFQCDARLYSLSTNAWKKLPDIPYCLFRLHMFAIFLNGALHFLATEIPQQSMPDKIVAFNLELETYYSVPPPIFGHWPQLRPDRRWLTIGVLDGCLTQVDNYCPEDHHFVVWIMKDYGVQKSWTKLYRIAYPEPIPMFNIGREHSIPASLRPISFSNNKKEILFMVHFSHLVSYNLESKTLHQVVHHNDQVVTWGMLLYEETLTSPLAGFDNGDHDEESMGLPEDIVINILLRLPVKSLLRFKSVSWPWYDLIADASFAPRHLEWSRKTSSKLHIVYTGSAFTLRHAEFDSFNGDASLDHPLVGENHTPIVVGATDGLLCLCDTSSIHLIFPFALYNPTTRSSHVLPSPLLDGFSSRFEHYLGFGYDATNDDYKVVKIAQQSKRDEPLRDFAQVYSLNTNSWKWVTPSPFRLTEFLFSGVCVNGVVHWVASSNPNEKLHDAIAAFDIANENYFMVSQPESLEPPLGRRCFLDIGVLEGCLSLVCNYPDMHYHDVWIMREYGVQSSWSKLFRIVDEEQSPVMLRPKSYSRDKREVFFMGFSNILLSYNVEENKLRRCDFPNRICWGVHIYEETLVSADAGYIDWDEQ